MMGHDGPDLRQVNPLMHADRLGRQIARQRRQTGWAEVGAVIDDIIGLIAHCAAMALMTGLGSAGLGFLPLLFAFGLSSSCLWSCRRTTAGPLVRNQAQARGCKDHAY